MAQSLFQYEKLHSNPQNRGRFSSMTTSLITSQKFGTVISGFNQQYSEIVTSLRTERMDIANNLSAKLDINKNYVGMRGEGVKLAWKYEKADIEMGGKGSGNWTEAERQEILEHGKVRGAEGHHGKNVADHPESQADPDNIRFYKSRQQHLQEGHDGDWNNSSEMPEIDKEKMLRNTNIKRTALKELQGVALSAAIAFGIGASIEVISTLAREGISPRSVKEALKNGVKAGLKCMFIAVGVYAISRVVQTVLQKVTSLSASWAGFVAGAIITAVVAGLEFYTLKKAGFSTRDALKKAGLSFIIRIAIMALGFIPYCGMYLSIAANIIYTAFDVGKGIYDDKFWRELDLKTAEWSLPVLA